MIKTYTLPLKSGQVILRRLDTDKIYNVVEFKSPSLRFSKKFPFIHFEGRTYVKFRYQDKFNTMRDPWDSKYVIDMTLKSFCSMLDIDYEPFEKHRITSVLMNGE